MPFRFGGDAVHVYLTINNEPYPRRSGTCAVGPSPAMPRARNEVFALIDDYIRWYNHERIKRSLGWMSPVQCRQSQGMAA